MTVECGDGGSSGWLIGALRIDTGTGGNEVIIRRELEGKAVGEDWLQGKAEVVSKD
jgi:hypothetical protein